MIERPGKESIDDILNAPREEIPSDELENHPDMIRFDMLEPWIEYLKKMHQEEGDADLDPDYDQEALLLRNQIGQE